MGLFRGRRASDPASAIEDFWGWWQSEGRAMAERTIAGDDSQPLVTAMSDHTERLGGLAWQLGAGDVSTHVLILSAEGDAEKRPMARRVVLAAPEADETWSYLDARPRTPDVQAQTVSTAGTVVDLARVTVTARLDGPSFDVQLFHPAFVDLPEDQRDLVSLVALDAALGEIDTELWIGEITAVSHAPLDGFSLLALRSVVDDVKAQRLGLDGEPGWQVLSGETPEAPLLAMVQSPLHPLTAPQLDTYVSVALPYGAMENGPPGEDQLGALREAEHRINARLGNHGRIVAHVSTGGVRTLHLYVDSTTDALAVVKQAAKAWHGHSTVSHMDDPGWQAVSHLRQ
jgi:hypothetical protein